ncbi:MAG TPA: sensor domain-containing phosphodiesterase [Dyella sp.]|uniref:putative bifunctional diguanylate cyclase/phosphodiesterase n=1 Tax=Dyella sp. TaxID=1869338 RepID=UPI002F93E339
MHTTRGPAPGARAAGLQDAPSAQAPASAGDSAESFAVPGFDAVVRLASHSLGMPLVALALVSGETYWYSKGNDAHGHATQTPRPLHNDAVHRLTAQVVLDTGGDAQLAEHPPGFDDAAPIRFFASEPVFTLTGQHIGALCVMDLAPREHWSDDQRNALRDAAELAGASVVLRSYLGRTDPVTQLPHRHAFFEDMRARLRDVPHAWVMAIDVAPVQRFNAFIRAMGHAYADELMRLVAQRAQTWLPADVRLYHVGVTRFAALLPDRDMLLDPDRLDDLVTRLRHPFDCLGIPLTIQPGVGLLKMYASTLRGGDPLRLVMSASYAAQSSTRGWAVYDQDQDEQQRQEFFLVTELAAALADQTELDLHYQPRVDLDTGRCVAVEALARWQHPTLGLIPPGQFIGLAERAGLMHSLTQWVLDRGLAQLAKWRSQGHQIHLSINVSNTDLGTDLVERLRQAAERHAVDPTLLELEFTESTLMEHSATTRRYLSAIRGLGAGIAIDDFGTGYSNLAALRQMPATSLKIDQSFVRGMTTSRHDEAIVRSVADLARSMDFRVVVEGVETERIYDSVLGMACDEAQGYHVSPPLPAAEVSAWLAGYQGMRARRDI